MTTDSANLPAHDHPTTNIDVAIANLNARLTAAEADIRALKAAQPPVITPIPPAYDQAPPSATTLVWTGQDQSAAYAALLLPGKQVALEPFKTYVMDDRTQLFSVHGVDVFGQGATVKAKGFYNPTMMDSWMRFITCQNWTIRDLELVGPFDGTSFYNFGGANAYLENRCGIRIDGGHLIELRRVKAHHYAGDPIQIAARGGTGDPYDSPDGITLTDVDAHHAGRNALSVTAGKNLTFNRGSFGIGGLAAVDFEPNDAAHPTSVVRATGTRFYGGDMGKTPSASHDGLGNGYPLYVSAGKAIATDHIYDGCSFDVGAIYVQAPSGLTNGPVTIRNCTADKMGEARFQRTTVTFTNNGPNITRVNVP